MNHRIGLKPGDILLMTALLLTALLLFLLPFLKEPGARAEILLPDTGEVKVLPLDKDAEYALTSREVALTVQVAKGKVSVVRSTCRDGICRNTPPISRGGQAIVCAPAGVVIRITGEEAMVDGITG